MSDPFGTDNEVRGFLSGGSTAAKFPKVGFTVEGTVLGYRMGQRTGMKSGEALFWEGKQAIEESKLKFESSKDSPAMQLIMEIQGEPTGVTWKTNQYIEETLPDDDGVRTLYVASGLQRALAKALRDAGNAQVEKGAYLKVTRGASVKAGDFMAFTYAAEWTPAKDNAKAATSFVSSEDGDGEDPFAG
jgi:hypothetical protein